MKTYYNLKLGRGDVMGQVIELNTENILENRLKDFINSFSSKENNLGFRLIKSVRNGTLYEVRIPEMQLSAGGFAPALCVATGLGWSKKGEDIIKLFLTDEELKLYNPLSRNGQPVYLDKITKRKAEGIKEDEFNYSMLQLYVLGF